MKIHPLFYLVICILFTLDLKSNDWYSQMDYYETDELFNNSYSVFNNIEGYDKIMYMDSVSLNVFDRKFSDPTDRENYKLLRKFISVKDRELIKIKANKNSYRILFLI